MEENEVIPIQNLIYEVRGLKVMFDSDLARLYGVLTKNLNKAVKRNIDKFPPEFMFQLTEEEWSDLRYQIGTSNEYRDEVVPNWNHLDKFKFRPGLPYVFTEHGVLMSANILNSENANIVSIKIIKVFVKLRSFILSQNGLSEQVTELRKLLMLHIENSEYKFSEHDKSIDQILRVLNNLIEKPKETKPIGFNAY